MITIIAFIVGVVVASVVWFFVWKNNKNKFAAALLEAEAKANAIADVVKIIKE
jgi:uncharacterized protein (UPF0333 family)